MDVTIVIISNLVVYSFSAGVVWSRLRSLEKAVLNGITHKLDDHSKRLDTHGESLARIDERIKRSNER